MVEKRAWAPSGVVPPGHTNKVLSDSRWEQVREIVKKHTEKYPPDAFRAALDNALQMYQAAHYLQKQNSPKYIRQNLKRARETALRLNERLNELDGDSRRIVSEIVSGGVGDLYDLLSQIILALHASEKKANELPQSRAGIRDFAPLNLGSHLARGIEAHLGKDLVSSDSTGLFAELYGVLARAVGVGSHHRGVRSAYAFWLEHRHVVPSRPSEA